MSFIQVEKISKFYFKKKEKKIEAKALQKISFDIHKGEIFSLLGVNGAGKTTLISILATLHPPTEGDIKWEGISIYQNLFKYRKIIGLCPQNPNADPELSLKENLLFSARCYGFSKNRAFENLEMLIEKFDLKQYANASVKTISGGYRQRFLIARALMHSPRLLLLDEPTVGLDSHVRREVWEIIKSLKKDQISTLLTTHYLDEAEYLADRICLLHEGTIRTIDTPENLIKLHQKNNLEEVFLQFVNDPNAEIFNANAGLSHEI